MSSLKLELRIGFPLSTFIFQLCLSSLFYLFSSRTKMKSIVPINYHYPTRSIGAMAAFQWYLPWGSSPESRCGSSPSWVTKVLLGSGSSSRRGGALSLSLPHQRGGEVRNLPKQWNQFSLCAAILVWINWCVGMNWLLCWYELVWIDCCMKKLCWTLLVSRKTCVLCIMCFVFFFNFLRIKDKKIDLAPHRCSLYLVFVGLSRYLLDS